ncbi:MAG: PTS sugar transporter subunit IIC [Bacillota bacterium]
MEFWQVIALTIWTGLCIFDILGPTVFLGFRPLIAGFGAGLIMGDVTLGMAIGATMELMALGVYTYGGATIPDYQTGAILGTAFAVVAGKGLEFGLTVGIPAALLMTQLDVVGRFLPTFWIHAADGYAEKADLRGISLMHWTAFTPWALSRMIPVFLACWLGSGAVQSFAESIPQWFMNGMSAVGHILPALGFAMLLKIMPVERYWYFLLLGFVLYAYLHTALLGIAIFALAVSIMFIVLKYRDEGVTLGAGRRA